MHDLRTIARETMVEAGFVPDVDEASRRELPTLKEPEIPQIRDLRSLPWSSIDNRESRDLDQVEVCEDRGEGRILVRVGIADVAALVPRGSAIDARAENNTTSVYTGVVVFPMLPEELSTDRTSLNENEDRLAIVLEYVVEKDGSVSEESVYRAKVRNHAQLVYEDVGAWLEGRAAAPKKVTPELEKQLRMQDDAACRLRERRHALGALDLETIEARPVAKEGAVVDLEVVHKTRASQLVEDFMIAANGVMARALDRLAVSSIRRVVKSPERWKRIVSLAASLGATLPEEADAKALSEFLAAQKSAHPERFADLSLSVVKLMGPGEYTVEKPGEPHAGHFGLAVQDYTHSTAPNRRFSDLVTQRMLESALEKKLAYSDEELAAIAARCTQKEDDARKVERKMRNGRGRAAPLLAHRPDLRRHRHRRLAKGHLRAPLEARRRRPRRARRTRPGRRRSSAGEAALDRRHQGLHRLRPRLISFDAVAAARREGIHEGRDEGRKVAKRVVAPRAQRPDPIVHPSRVSAAFALSAEALASASARGDG